MSTTDISIHLAAEEAPEDFSIEAHLRVDTASERYVVWKLKLPDSTVRFYATVEPWGRIVNEMEASILLVAEELAEARGVEPDADVHELAGGPPVLVRYDDGNEAEMARDDAADELLGAISDDSANKRWGIITDPGDDDVEWSAEVSVRLVKLVKCGDCGRHHQPGSDCPVVP